MAHLIRSANNNLCLLPGTTTLANTEGGLDCICDKNQPVGACCIDQNCFQLTEVQCLNQGGLFLGPDEVCSPNPCASDCGQCPPAYEITLTGGLIELIGGLPTDCLPFSYLDVPTIIVELASSNPNSCTWNRTSTDFICVCNPSGTCPAGTPVNEWIALTTVNLTHNLATGSSSLDISILRYAGFNIFHEIGPEFSNPGPTSCPNQFPAIQPFFFSPYELSEAATVSITPLF